ncbi:hypothetical protein GCM10023091_06400 [Ravibacter arvi]|uniref:DNA-binding response regulator n=1 Tax=Ravibacter arvi TaxID=2051041 RepID=A0ABP8LP68_9BACT
MTKLPKILLVDDSEEVIAYLADLLYEEYQIITTSNGEEAIRELQRENIQLVISDVMMPLMDGLELCRLIRSDERICHVPVILLTAKDSMQSKIEGLETGADAYIEKPFYPKYLLAQVSNLLQNRKQLRDFFSQSPFVHVGTIAHTRSDVTFLEEVSRFVLSRSDEAELDMDLLADNVNMSRMTFYRKIKAVTDMTPRDYVNLVRLKRAAELLTDGTYKIYEIASMTGYKSATHFSKLFHKQFGLNPMEFVRTTRSKDAEK